MRMIKRFFHKSITWWNSWSWWSSSTLIMIMIVNIWSRWWWWLIHSHKDHNHDHDQMIMCDATHFKMWGSAGGVEKKFWSHWANVVLRIISWPEEIGNLMSIQVTSMKLKNLLPTVRKRFESDGRKGFWTSCLLKWLSWNSKTCHNRSRAFWIRWPEGILNLMSI